MCDFKPGDEVVYVGHEGIPRLPEHRSNALVKRGDVFTVRLVAPWRKTELFALILNEHPNTWFDARCFRKVQRRDLSAWLETAATNTDKWDKPIKTPARPKVDALLKRVQSGAFG